MADSTILFNITAQNTVHTEQQHNHGGRLLRVVPTLETFPPHRLTDRRVIA